MEFRKTYLSTSLRIPFTKQSFSTYFIKYNNIFIQLKRSKIENRFEANRYFFFYIVRFYPFLHIIIDGRILNKKNFLFIYIKHIDKNILLLCIICITYLLKSFSLNQQGFVMNRIYHKQVPIDNLEIQVPNQILYTHQLTL